ncbi:MAG: hydantoinase/oxoprolinase family protein, partial [Gammaproteobacteria bacterium]|nr:hydantoinase/oxoprolinase family protein [Gammaproteobacteria bacterium]
DMGGTSTDVCLVSAGEPAMQNERSIAGLPVRTRGMDIHTVGAGGGSLAWIDPAGLLKVGPASAGAHPGPAAYLRGGQAPTVTDANFVLGRLAEGELLGGRMTCSLDAARRAVQGLATRLGLGLEETAAGIIQIVNTNMVGALRTVSVERGHDPRDFALLAYGGAGPLHAVEVAARMGIRRVIVPPRPGLLSALGLLQADERADFSVTRLVCLGDAPGDQGGAGSTAAAVIAQGFAELQARAQAWIDREGLAPAAVRLQPRVDMRYLGQSFEIEVPLASVPADQSLEGIDLLGQDGGLVEAFHARHAVLNGYAAREQAVEVVTLRLAALAPAKLLRTRAAAATGVAAAGPADGLADGLADGPADVPVVSTRRPVWFEDHGSLPTPVLERDALRPGQRLHGPAVLVQMDSTTLLPPDCEAEVDADANLVIHLRR